MRYIQRKCLFSRLLETVDEFETYKEACKTVREYRLGDPYAEYYVSSRACKVWLDNNKNV